MNQFYFSFDQSPWWLIVIIAVSAGLSWLLYSGKLIWDGKILWILRALRFLSVFLILFLLLSPAFNAAKSFKEKPIFTILTDNSQSATLAGHKEADLKELISGLKQYLDNQGYDTRLIIHQKSIDDVDSLKFDNKTSDIANLIKAGDDIGKEKDYKLLLISDGIFNSGSSPVYQKYRSDIYTLGLGDTVPRKDLILKSIHNNSVAFLGNKFSIEAEVLSVGFSGKRIEVTLNGGKGLIEKKSLQIKEDFENQNIDFIIPAEKTGFQKFTIEINASPGESNLLNNIQHAYVDVIDDRENVLIAASAPHPGIKAIKAALSGSENLHTELFISGVNKPERKSYDLVILHNALLSNLPELKSIVKETTSLLYIAGSETDFSRFNTENGLVEIIPSNQKDQVQGALNPAFERFKIAQDAGQIISNLPPVEVTFGDIKLKGASEILLYQKINGIESKKPLLVFGHTNRKSGVFLTDGFWLWRMYESQETESTKNIDELLTKTIQYLSSKEDKRKFRIYPDQKEYYEGDQIRIETELYNDIYERIFQSEVRLTISGPDKKNQLVQFSTSEGNTAVNLPFFNPGVYKVTGTALHGGKKLSSNTELVVKERQLEALNLQANHQLLRELSKKNGGKFFALPQLNSLKNELGTFKPKPIWKKTETKRELIDELWYFLLILASLSAEWMLRRYNGGY